MKHLGNSLIQVKQSRNIDTHYNCLTNVKHHMKNQLRHIVLEQLASLWRTVIISSVPLWPSCLLPQSGKRRAEVGSLLSEGSLCDLQVCRSRFKITWGAAKCRPGSQFWTCPCKWERWENGRDTAQSQFPSRKIGSIKFFITLSLVDLQDKKHKL